MLFLAKVPSVGYAVYDVQPDALGHVDLKVQNRRWRIIATDHLNTMATSQYL
jgi:hypothetical protein